MNIEKIDPDQSSSEEVLTYDEYIEYERLLRLQDAESKDAKDFGPYWLEGIQGSLAEERRKSKRNKDLCYNSLAREARRFARRLDFSLQSYLADPQSLDIKLSQLWARYPSLEISFQFSVQKVVRSNVRLLRGFLIYYYTKMYELLPGYLKFEIESQLDQLLFQEVFPMNESIRKECLVIRKLFLNLERSEAQLILFQQYSESNIQKWLATQKILWNKVTLVYIPLSRTKEKVRKRGYRESRCNKHKSRDERGEVMKSTESRSLEEIKQSILKKQAILFEKRLDAYLALESSELTPAERKKIFIDLIETSDGNLPESDNTDSKIPDENPKL